MRMHMHMHMHMHTQAAEADMITRISIPGGKSPSDTPSGPT